MKLILAEVELLGDASKVFVGGFSQGGVLANGVVLHPQCPPNLGGIFAQSGLQSFPSEGIKLPSFPILLVHGTDDDVINYTKSM